MEGDIFANGGGKKDTPVYRIEGKWNESASLIHKNGEREVLWTKRPYPEKWEYMYGMSHFML